MQVFEAVRATCDGPFPLPEDETTAVLLANAVQPAVDSLPSHLQCEAVAMALSTMFVMGLSAGAELGRRDAS